MLHDKTLLKNIDLITAYKRACYYELIGSNNVSLETCDFNEVDTTLDEYREEGIPCQIK